MMAALKLITLLFSQY